MVLWTSTKACRYCTLMVLGVVYVVFSGLDVVCTVVDVLAIVLACMYRHVVHGGRGCRFR